MDTTTQRNNRQVATWLLIGVGMIIIQILLGGITRLTESGLSITEWKPITGTLPPLNEAAWQAEFDKYKVTDQFKYVHQNFSLANFKFIFFWEWFHRLWARLLAVVFVIGFAYFIFKKKFNKQMITPMIILFVLGAMQGAIGWLMVKSGLVPEKYFVGHVELTTHFIAALGLLCYTLWFALSLLIKPKQIVINVPLQKMMLAIMVILFFQLIYGAFMAGLKAAVSAPTWPSINGSMVPATMNELSPWSKNLVSNNIMVHFVHRGLAYVLFILITVWYFKAGVVKKNRLFGKLRFRLLILVTLQLVLGIFTVLKSTQPNGLLLFGALHQFIAMLLVMCIITLLYLLRKKSVI
ncbi:COX15/CtaA family protein [Ferruginibacter sp.]|nr:COX15/CtaA family protein [Ferruginibacter sp.]